MELNLFLCIFKALKPFVLHLICKFCSAQGFFFHVNFFSLLIKIHSFSYGFLFSNQNGLLWFTGCMPVLFLEELRFNRPTVRIPSSFKCLLRSELEVFGAASSPGAGLSGLKNHELAFWRSCVCWEHVLTALGCLGFALITPVVILTSKK